MTVVISLVAGKVVEVVAPRIRLGAGHDASDVGIFTRSATRLVGLAIADFETASSLGLLFLLPGPLAGALVLCRTGLLHGTSGERASRRTP